MPVLEFGYDTLVFAEALCRAVLEATWENVVVFQLGLQPRVFSICDVHDNSFVLWYFVVVMVHSSGLTCHCFILTLVRTHRVATEPLCNFSPARLVCCSWLFNFIVSLLALVKACEY